MKKLIIVFSLIIFAVQLNTAHVLRQERPAAEIKFDKTTHDFAKVKKGTKDLNCKFTYTNTGGDMLFITRIVQSCGCTEPTYSKEPLMPGQSTEIEVGYTATDQLGIFNKKLTIFTNALTESVILTIKGEVVE